ncbi:hypothetical protein ACN28S_58125 [Cystobacter fuscus]
MNRRFLYCVLQGPAFSPARAAERTGLALVDANEPGDVPPRDATPARPSPTAAPCSCCSMTTSSPAAPSWSPCGN